MLMIDVDVDKDLLSVLHGGLLTRVATIHVITLLSIDFCFFSAIFLLLPRLTLTGSVYTVLKHGSRPQPSRQRLSKHLFHDCICSISTRSSLANDVISSHRHDVNEEREKCIKH